MATVRFAPSPTGKLHLGSARTAVFNWLYARHTKGKMVLRIEDTDLSRSEDVYTESIIKDMKWMGMDYDEFHKQSDRFDIYRSYADKLLQAGKAYYCTCTREELTARNSEIGSEALKYDGHCRGRTQKPEGQHVLRVDIGGERFLTFKDLVKNKLSVSTKELDDFVIMKSDNSPTYNFAVVVDDALMKMTHIVRGEDHITNTFKQIILYEYFGFPIPEFAHLPLVMGKDKSPLSKRKGSTNVESYRAMGILPSALLNAIARLGWSHGNDEIFTMEQLVEFFDLEKLNKSNAVYDEEKMVWVNGKHMKSTPADKLIACMDECLKENGWSRSGKMTDSVWMTEAVELLKGRNTTLVALFKEISEFSGGEYALDDEAGKVLSGLLGDENMKKAAEETKTAVIKAGGYDSFEALEKDLKAIADNHAVKFGDLVQVLRVRLTGKTKSPDIIAVMKLLGKDNVIKRMSA